MLRSVATLTTSNFVVQLVTVAAYPILTAIFSPASFGVFGVVTSISIVASVLFCFRIDTLIQIEEHEYEIPLWRLALLLGSVSSVLFAVGLYLAIGLGLVSIPRQFFGDREIIVILVTLITFCNGLNPVGRQYFVKHQAYARVARSQLIRVVATLGLQIGIGLVLPTTIGLLIGFAVGIVVSTTLLLPPGLLDVGAFRDSVKSGWRQVRENSSLLITDCINVTLSTSSSSLQLLLSLFLFGASSTGILLLANRLILIPVEILGAALSAVYFERLSKGVREKTRLLPTFFQSLGLSMLSTLPAVAGIVLFLGPVVRLFLPTEWEGVTPIGLALIPTLIARMAVASVGYTALSLRRPLLISMWNLYQLIIVMGASFIAYLGKINLEEFVLIHGIALLIGTFIYILTLYRFVARQDMVQPQ